jgi:hypothetical protein
MSKQQEPKRPRQRSWRLNVTSKAKWESILKEVQKDEVPVTVLQSMVVNLKDGTSVLIDVSELLAEGLDPDMIQEEINSKLVALDHIIRDVDFHINVDSVAKAIQPITDKLLKDL